MSRARTGRGRPPEAPATPPEHAVRLPEGAAPLPEGTVPQGLEVSVVECEGGTRLVLSFPLRPARWPECLTQAERAVAELVLDGASNAEIAAARGTSRRTVANQIATIFRKLDASSRVDLAARIFGATRG